MPERTTPPAPSSVTSERGHVIGDPDPTTKEAAERAAEVHRILHDYHRLEQHRLFGLAQVLRQQVQQGLLVEYSEAFMNVAGGQETCSGLSELAGEHEWSADTHEEELIRLSNLGATLPSEYAH